MDDLTASDFIVQDLGDNMGLDLLDGDGDAIAFGLSTYELRDRLHAMDPASQVWVEGGALGQGRGVKLTPAEVLRLLR